MSITALPLNTDTAVAPRLDQLRALEAESIHIMREVVAEFERPVLLFSGGKDSIVLVRLAQKAFAPGRVPFPLLHVDTGHNFPEVLEHRVLHVRRDDHPVAERLGGPGEHLLRRGVRSEFSGAALGERAQIDFGSKAHRETSGTPIPIIFREKVRRQAAQYQAPCDASDGRRSSSPQYGQ